MLGLEATYNIFQSPSLSASLSLMLPKSEGQMNVFPVLEAIST